MFAYTTNYCLGACECDTLPLSNGLEAEKKLQDRARRLPPLSFTPCKRSRPSIE